jgi:hypothetical protein
MKRQRSLLVLYANETKFENGVLPTCFDLFRMIMKLRVSETVAVSLSFGGLEFILVILNKNYLISHLVSFRFVGNPNLILGRFVLFLSASL